MTRRSTSHLSETILDLDLIAPEFVRLVSEFRGIPGDLHVYKREQALSDPLSRVELVRRALVAILERHGWLSRCKSQRVSRVALVDPRQLVLAIDLVPRRRSSGIQRAYRPMQGGKSMQRNRERVSS